MLTSRSRMWMRFNTAKHNTMQHKQAQKQKKKNVRVQVNTIRLQLYSFQNVFFSLSCFLLIFHFFFYSFCWSHTKVLQNEASYTHAYKRSTKAIHIHPQFVYTLSSFPLFKGLLLMSCVEGALMLKIFGINCLLQHKGIVTQISQAASQPSNQPASQHSC